MCLKLIRVVVLLVLLVKLKVVDFIAEKIIT